MEEKLHGSWNLSWPVTPVFCWHVANTPIAQLTVTGSRAPCGFSRRFEDVVLTWRRRWRFVPTYIKEWRLWRTQISGLLKNEDYQLPHLLKVKIAFSKLLKTEDLKTPLKNVKKMKTVLCAESPRLQWSQLGAQDIFSKCTGPTWDH